jgi:glycosyltransferase involved in cell wall biosynthesis
MKKKIFFLSYNDNFGGAGIAAYNMFKSIPSRLFKKKFLCINKFSNDKEIIKIKINFIPLIKILFSILLSKFVFLLFNTNTKVKRNLALIKTDLLKELDLNKVDILHVQWFFNEVVSLDEILKFKKKIIISTHDLWFSNGSLHYNIKSKNLITKFFEEKLLKNKINKILSKKNITFTTPSLWSKNQLIKIIKRYNYQNKIIPKIYVIKNAIIKPNKIEKLKLRSKYLINNSSYIGLIQYEKKNDFIKGYDILFKILKKINNDMIYKYFILFGNNTKNFPTDKFSNLIFINFGFIQNNNISNIYYLGDYMIVTSRQETFSQLTAESLIHDRPVITFKDTGQAELIKHKQNGYLAKSNNIKDFVNGISFFQKNNFIRTANCKKLIISNFYQNKLSKLYE